MTESLLALVASWGAYAVALSAFLSCLLVPIPTALVMLAGGAFAAAGDLSLAGVLAAGWGGAVLGDQTGYRIGRSFGPAIERLASRRQKAEATYTRARGMVAEKGGQAVFLSTWALAPLGPYVNFAAGAGGLGAMRFTLWDAAGEAIWVGFYVLMGYQFSTGITELASLLSDAAGFVVAAAAAIVLGFVLVRRLREHPRE
jgi:membrane protein DedA with SNARE-associated domain